MAQRRAFNGSFELLELHPLVLRALGEGARGVARSLDAANDCGRRALATALSRKFLVPLCEIHAQRRGCGKRGDARFRRCARICQLLEEDDPRASRVRGGCAGKDALHEAKTERVFCSDVTPRCHQRESFLGANEPRQPLRALAAREETDIHFWKAKARCCDRDSVMAHE